MANARKTPYRYRIIAQNRGDEIVIGIDGEQQCLIRSAHEILANKEMINSFPPAQAALIGIIAGMEIAPECRRIVTE